MNPRLALIGCGGIGAKRQAALPVGTFVAFCDTTPERAEKLAATARKQGVGQQVTADYRAAIDNPQVDAVVVATINAHLAPISEYAIRKGKPVLVEKPAGTSLQQLVALRELAQEKGVPVRVGFNHRFHPALRQAHALLQSGALGPLMFVRARYGHGGRVGYEQEWRANPQLSGGGELIDQGVHLIDLARLFLGDFVTIKGQAATYFWRMPVDDNAFLHLETATGQTAWLHVSCTEWKNTFSFEVYGQRAKLHVEGLGGSYGVERLAHYHMRPEMGPPDTTIYEYPGADTSWHLELMAFVEDIKTRRTPEASLADACAALRIVEHIYGQSGELSRTSGVRP